MKKILIYLSKTDIATCIYLLQQDKFKIEGKTKRYIQLSKILEKFEKVYFNNKKTD